MASDQTNPTKPESTSPSELFSSAQVLGQAAMSAFGQKSGEVDKAKTAGAAADMLHAASEYGKLDQKGYGQYVGKAETYLDQYAKPTAATDKPTAATDQAPPPAAQESGKEEKAEKTEESEGGLGGVMNMAEGFMSKESSGSGESAGGAGDVMKMAQGFWGKK